MATKELDVRRRPEQARSQARVRAILEAAAKLIGERGADAVSMTDIAKQADMSKAAVYRYFPNRQSVVRELAITDFHENRNNIIAAWSNSSKDPRSILREGLLEYCELHRSEPYRLQLRAAIHADAELSGLDLADSRANAAAIADILLQNDPAMERMNLETRILLVIELLDGVIRLAARVKAAEADAMLDQFTSMAVRHIFDE